MKVLELDITDDEVEAAFEPFVTKRYSVEDPAWSRIVRESARALRGKRLKRRLIGWLPWMRHTQKVVTFNYSRQWAERPLDVQLSIGGPTVPCVWRGTGMFARAIGTKRVHLLFLMRAIERLKPRTILEVGSGNGLNLFILAARFPDIRFTGLELTAGGVVATNRVRTMAEVPEALVTFAPEPLIDLKPFDRIVIVQGNAAALPFADASFDLVITVLALEQMEPIRHQALAEIRRVARAYTAMVEPFFDWNATGPERDYIVSKDYFRGSVAELEQIGLTPVYATANMPSKLTIRPAFVVCRTH